MIRIRGTTRDHVESFLFDALVSREVCLTQEAVLESELVLLRIFWRLYRECIDYLFCRHFVLAHVLELHLIQIRLVVGISTEDVCFFFLLIQPDCGVAVA